MLRPCAACMGEEERPNSEHPRRVYLVIELLRLRAACIGEEERPDSEHPRRAVRESPDLKRRVNYKGDDDSIYEVEELCVNIGEFPALLGTVKTASFLRYLTPPTILKPALHINDLKVILTEYSDLEANSILNALFESKQIGIVATPVSDITKFG
ncbi:13_t:CDS:2 [Dentiscutata heterogama]|uniref:13_t:CDS:1 n=1 Tax=Dentiscutata heterogama TaxID=1316150 RepID=A0ACA9LZW3_9GLOM|nr:13_t:CDS:2 [Dentiscutata heterogama]